MAFRLTSTQEVEIAEVKGIDKRGNSAPLENVVITSSDDTVLSIADADGKKFVRAVGPLGNAQIQVSADARIGDGEKVITGTVDIEVVAGEAAILQVALGAAQEQAE